jgi:hypothetical protein
VVTQIHPIEQIKGHQMFTTELQTGTITAVGSIEFDDMDNAIISISINGQTLTDNKISVKEFEVLRRYFAEVK